MPETKVLVEVKNIYKSFKQADRVIKVLEGVSLVARDQEITIVMGPSGSGKTTLLSIMGLLLSPDDGKVFLNGEDIIKLPQNKKPRVRYKKLGFVFQTANLIPSLAVLDNVLVASSLLGDVSSKKKKRAVELLKRVGLGDRLTHLPFQLARGEQQRVALARALINDPLVLLADEPTGNLDAASGQIVMKLIREIAQEGSRTAIVVSHDNRIEPFADQALYLEGGAFKEKLSHAFGPTDTILRGLTDGVIVLTQKGVVSLINHPAEQIFGWTEIEMLGQSLSNFVHLYDLKDKEVVNGRLEELEGERILAFEDKEREKKILNVRIAQVDGELVKKTVLTFRDITGEYYLEKRKDLFITEVSHRLRTPLTAMKGFFELVGDQEVDFEEKKGLAEKVKLELLNLEALTERLVLVSTLEKETSISREKTAIKEFISALAETYRPLALVKGLNFKEQLLVPNDLAMDLDLRKMQIALGNIIENAIHYTVKGEITIRCDVDVEPGELEIEVIDTGRGIGPEFRQHIFKRFTGGSRGYEVTGEGVGLGLFISKKIVNLHGGEIYLTSEKGKGTQVKITLPLEKGAEEN